MKISRHTILSIFLALTLCLAGTAIAKGPKAPPLLPDIPEEWTQILPADLYPDFEFEALSPACSNGLSATDDEFFFFVKKGTVNNVVVYFQGGGACWDPITCLAAESYDTECTDEDSPENHGGIFDFQNPENPFKDWSFIFVPYCTGDVHIGANDKEYSIIISVDPLVVLTRTIQHRGAVNFHVVLKWMKENIFKPHKIFVTGSSAGSYGAIAGFPWIKEAYKKSLVSLLGDAGMGVNPPEYNAVSQANWNSQFAPWLLENPDEIDLLEIWQRMVKRYRHSKMAEFTNAFDGTQISFYYYTFITLGLTPPEPEYLALDWHVKMWEGLDFKADAKNYRYYVAPGTSHTILGRDLVYEETSENGIRFIDWLEALVKSQGKPRGHGAMPWVNIACEDCRY